MNRTRFMSLNITKLLYFSQNELNLTTTALEANVKTSSKVVNDAFILPKKELHKSFPVSFWGRDPCNSTSAVWAHSWQLQKTSWRLSPARWPPSGGNFVKSRFVTFVFIKRVLFIWFLRFLTRRCSQDLVLWSVIIKYFSNKLMVLQPFPRVPLFSDHPVYSMSNLMSDAAIYIVSYCC